MHVCACVPCTMSNSVSRPVCLVLAGDESVVPSSRPVFRTH